MGRLGLIAGGGGLPLAVARHCEAAGRPLFVARLEGVAEADLREFEGADVLLGQLGRCVRALREAGCASVCFAGVVRRPDFRRLKPDLLALKHLPEIAAAAGRGDDALLRAVLGVFEAEGFAVEGVAQAAPALLLGAGPLGQVAPTPEDLRDIETAMAGAREVGLTDVGQAAVAGGGELVAVEDERGTDALLERCAPAPGGRAGVLAKAPKPGQDRRVDLPTIGVATVERAALAGLAGIAGEAGAILVVDKPAVRAAADRLGLFVFGVEPAP